MKTGEGVTLQFTYNEINKPSTMKLEGVGYMDITYDEYGEIDEISSYDEKGGEAGAQLSMQITSTFQVVIFSTIAVIIIQPASQPHGNAIHR